MAFRTEREKSISYGYWQDVLCIDSSNSNYISLTNPKTQYFQEKSVYHNNIKLKNLRNIQSKHIVSLLLLVIFTGCKPVKLSDARMQYLRGEYFAASETYRKVYRKLKQNERPMRGVVAFEMAEAYRHLNSSQRAITSYANAIRYGYPDTLMFLHYAQMLHRDGKYKQAETAYQDYLKLNPNDYMAINGLRGIELALTLQDKSSRYIVRRMDIFNSNRGEFSPLLAQDDAMLYITSSREDARGDTISAITGMKNNDVFVASKNDKGEWQKPEIITSEINTKSDEGSPTISPDGNYMYYTFSPVSDVKPTTTKIYYSLRGAGTFSAGQELVINDADTTSLFAHPSVSPSGDYLYFVSDMAGGYGGKDIWRAGLSGNTVLFIENMGSDINTPGDEMFPYVRNDSTLYFSSTGHPGLGGLDLFRATRNRNNDGWNVSNMGVPVNSSADDFGITFEKEKEKGFFSSNRGDARGRDHIYSFEYPDVNVFVEGFAVDKEDQFIQGASISVIGADGSQQNFTTKKDGTYSFRAERGVNYLFMASAKDFLNVKKTLYTTPEEKDTTYYVDFEMSPYTKPVILENIFYDFDKATLRPESKEELDGLIALLNDNPEIVIELSAHTDRKGSEEYNQKLSLRRAQSVVDYLINSGIDERRLQAAGYGELQPKEVTKGMGEKFDFLKEGEILTEEYIENLLPEQQEIADQINRRTEFKVIETNFGLH